MQLSFLGKPYTADFPAIAATETQDTVNFMGRSSKIKQYTVAQRQRPTEELTFRGCRYSR